MIQLSGPMLLWGAACTHTQEPSIKCSPGTDTPWARCFFFLLPLIVHFHMKCIQGYTVIKNTTRFQEAADQLASSADILGYYEMEVCGGRSGRPAGPGLAPLPTAG